MGLFPTYIAESAYSVDYDRLYKKGYRYIIFDIDYTLVPYNAMADERAISLIRSLKDKGFICMLVSNNHEPRVAGFNKDIGIDYVVDALKPMKRGFEAAVRKMKADRKEVIALGDQIFTDVLGASRAGIDSIMTGRVAKPGELQLKIKVVLEKLILYIYKHSGRYSNIDRTCETEKEIT